MIATPQSTRFTPSEYFEWEAKQAMRYEYFDGEVFATAGGTLAHADIALNVATYLKEALKGHCKVRNSDAKVGITQSGPFLYPDVSVSCDERDRTAQKFSRYPCIIIEVISPSTEAYDRGGKFSLYRRIDSVKDYVLIGSESKTVEVFHRNENGEWMFVAHEAEGEVSLASVDVTIPIDSIYEDVNLSGSDE